MKAVYADIILPRLWGIAAPAGAAGARLWHTSGGNAALTFLHSHPSAGAKASASNINTQSEELKAVQSKLDGIESILDTKYEDLKAKIDGLTAKINTPAPTSRSTSK